jgi:hypothetical protein
LRESFCFFCTDLTLKAPTTYLNCALINGLQRKTNRNEINCSIQELYEIHPMDGLVFSSMMDEYCGSKGFFRCGSPFVA